MLMEVIDVMASINKLSKVAMIEQNLFNRLIAFLNEFSLATFAWVSSKSPHWTRFRSGIIVFLTPGTRKDINSASYDRVCG